MNNLAQFNPLILNLLCCWIILILPIQQDTTKRVYKQHLERQCIDLKKMNRGLDSLVLVLKIDTTKFN